MTNNNIIDLDKWRRRLESDTERRLHNAMKIIAWSADMQQRGLMPPDVAQAFHEHFSGERVD
jgi:hypothetical protein